MIFVLDNIRSAWNVGSIMRTADALGFDIILTGYTPRPEGATLGMIKKTAIGAENTVKWEYFSHFQEVLSEYSKGIHLGIEISQTSQNIFEFLKNDGLRGLAKLKKIEERNISGQTYLWLGNEISGLSQGLIDGLDIQLHLPMAGSKESLNVSSCACAAGYLLQYAVPNIK